MNSIGNVGGFVGPFLMGWIREATGGFTAGLLTLAGDRWCIGAVIVLSIQCDPNKRRD